MKNDFEGASERFEEFLAAHEAKTYKAWCMWQLGNCYSFMNRTSEALETYRYVATYSR